MSLLNGWGPQLATPAPGPLSRALCSLQVTLSLQGQLANYSALISAEAECRWVWGAGGIPPAPLAPGPLLVSTVSCSQLSPTTPVYPKLSCTHRQSCSPGPFQEAARSWPEFIQLTLDSQIWKMARASVLDNSSNATEGKLTPSRLF